MTDIIIILTSIGFRTYVMNLSDVCYNLQYSLKILKKIEYLINAAEHEYEYEMSIPCYNTML